MQWLDSSDGTLSNFSNLNVLPNPSQGDTVNAWRSSNIHVSYGLIDGNYTPNGSGVQADKATSNMFVDNVDVIHAMNTGFATYGAGGDTAAFSNVRVRDTVCSSSQGLPSSGGIAFIGPVLGSGTKTNVSFDNAVYFNLCNSVTHLQSSRNGAWKLYPCRFQAPHAVQSECVPMRGNRAAEKAGRS